MSQLDKVEADKFITRLIVILSRYKLFLIRSYKDPPLSLLFKSFYYIFLHVSQIRIFKHFLWNQIFKYVSDKLSFSFDSKNKKYQNGFMIHKNIIYDLYDFSKSISSFSY